MQKKLIALAVASVVSAPVLADTANVTVYGTINTTAEIVKATGATASQNGNSATPNKPNRNRITSNSSRIGFKGTEALGGGLNAIFQIETSFASDTGGWGAGRDTFVGLQGDSWGAVKLGRNSSPTKIVGDAFDFHQENTGFAASAALVNGISTQNGKSPAGQRVSNSIVYASPSWGGFKLWALYGANENKTNDDVASNGGQRDDHTYEISGMFTHGGLKVGLAYGQYDDNSSVATYALGFGAGNTTYDPGTDGGETEDWRAGVSYKFGPVTVGALYNRLEAKGPNNAGVEGGVKRDVWHLPVMFEAGPHTAVAQYTKAKQAKAVGAMNQAVVDDSGATMWSLGYYYALSNRTKLEAYYAKLSNKQNARFDFDTGGLTPASGADPQGIAVGIRHNF